MTAEAAPVEAAPEAPLVPWWLILIEGVLAIIIGILLVTNPRATTAVLVQVLGIYWLVAGIVKIVSIFIDSTAWGWKLFAGIIGIIAGILILQHPLWSTLLVPAVLVIVLGIQGLIFGVIEIIQAFQGGGWGIGILGVLSIIFGIILLSNLFVATLALPFVFGIFGIIGGVIAIIFAFRVRSETA